MYFVAVHSMPATVLQDGSFSYPADGADYKYLLEVRAEAEYYGLTGLVETIDRYPVSTLPASTQSFTAIFYAPNQSCPMCTLMLYMHKSGRCNLISSQASACSIP